MNELTIYESAKYHLAQYNKIDEVKDYRDQAAAVEMYAKQANDTELEEGARRARQRAERKCGELLKASKRPQGRRTDLEDGNLVVPDDQVEVEKTLEELGLTKDQSSRFQKMADISEEEFEDILKEPGAAGLRKYLDPEKEEEPALPSVSRNALWLWGELVDFEKLGMFELSINDLLEEMTSAMRSDTERLVPLLKEWLNERI